MTVQRLKVRGRQMVLFFHFHKNLCWSRNGANNVYSYCRNVLFM